MGIFADLLGIFACLLQGIWDIWYPPLQASFGENCVNNLRHIVIAFK